MGEKISIVSPRPQTTRHLVRGIVTLPQCQYIFVDAPGNPPRLKSVLHKALNRRVAEAASEADVVLFVAEALRYGPEDRAALERIPPAHKAIAVVNKVDTVKRAAELIPYLERL
ncbi:MAG: GTPase Era, partial [Betaproteobacteria bacterium]